MIEELTHYFRKGTRPFQSLSALPELEAISIMEKLYVPGSILWRRFADPWEYLDFRKRVEHQLLTQFKSKGGLPKTDHPIYFVVGTPKWAVQTVDPLTMATTEAIRVPLSRFEERELSFTFPDSMYAAIMRQNGEPVLPDSHYNGEALTLVELRRLVSDHDLPLTGWKPNLPPHLDHYIEAQVWNEAVLEDYLSTHSRDW